MVYYSLPVSEDLLDSTFGALADPTRRAILARLSEGESTVKSLAALFPMSLPAVSKHLRVLRSAGLLKREIDGRIHRCRLDADPLKEAAAFIERYRRFWEAQFDALGEFLASSQPSADKEKNQWPPQNPDKSNPPATSNSAAPSRSRAKRSSRPGPTASS
jgi:DNA-binding transcriptional ArsR family regulator